MASEFVTWIIHDFAEDIASKLEAAIIAQTASGFGAQGLPERAFQTLLDVETLLHDAATLLNATSVFGRSLARASLPWRRAMSPRWDLESAVQDAAIMSRIAVEYIGQVLGFDQRTPRKLDPDEATHLTFLVLDVCQRAEQAHVAFADWHKTREATHAD